MIDTQKSYWELKAKTEIELCRPERDLPLKTDVLIVGGGFAGCWLAYFIKKKHPRREVTIVERSNFSEGASTKNAGFLSCGNISEWVDDLKVLGFDEIVKTMIARINGIEIIKSELSPRSVSESCGSVDFDELTTFKQELMTRLNDSLAANGYQKIYLCRDVNFGGSTKTVAFNSYDSQCDPVEILLRLRSKLLDLGVDIYTQTNVKSMQSGKCCLAGDRENVHIVEYGRGFLCTNAFSPRIHKVSSVEPARGQIMVTSPVSCSTSKTLGYRNGGYDYFRFVGDRLLVGGGRANFKGREATDEFGTTEDIGHYLINFARTIVGHEDFEPEYHWSGIMGMRKGIHASVTDLATPVTVDDHTIELAGFGGWGVTLAPYITKGLAASL